MVRERQARKQASQPERSARKLAAIDRQDETAFSITPPIAFALLLLARGASAQRNLVHDCDEVYNYWEPLHFALYGSGMQTWEYSAKYALRSWLYILLHALPAAPFAWLYGAGAGKLGVFINIRAALGAVSAFTETLLYSAVKQHCSAGMAARLLVLLCLSSGMFTAATTLLPSTFAMYACTAASAALLADRRSAVVLAAAVGILWGWVVAAVAFVPHALCVLLSGPLLPVVQTAVSSLLALGGLLVAADVWFYDRWTVSLWNFVKYNVIGGGQSSLYGVEGPLFYLHNGGLAFNLALLLALALPLLVVLHRRVVSRGGPRSKLPSVRLWTAVAPVWVWLAVISALPHKEERFLYVVYPLICLAAAASLGVLEDVAAAVAARCLRARTAARLARALSGGLLLLTCMLSVSRSTALLRNYGAPMVIYRSLPQMPPQAVAHRHVCVGEEWYRFPSSFHLPAPQYRLQFVKSGFAGLLPRPFDPVQGGARAAPQQLNNQNREEPDNYWAGSRECDYWVGHSLPPDSTAQEWAVVASAPFLDKDLSPALTRAFYIPWLSERRNKFRAYSLWRRRSAAAGI